MSRVPRKDSAQEVLVRKFLFSKGFRFKKNVKNLPGSPDIVLPKYKTVIFINGCFWHGHSCRKGRLPTSNLQFWTDKIETNKKRDRKKNFQLKKLGWKIITIWQCHINDNENIDKSLNKLVERIREINSPPIHPSPATSEKPHAAPSDTKTPSKRYRPAAADTAPHPATPAPGWSPEGSSRT